MGNKKKRYTLNCPTCGHIKLIEKTVEKCTVCGMPCEVIDHKKRAGL